MKHLKQEFDKLTFKEALCYAICVTTLIAAFVLLFMSMFIAPEGEIHDSVLTAYGLSLGFVATSLGVSMHYANELTKFKSKAIEIMRNESKKQDE